MDPARADALLARLSEARVLWLLHVNADADCVGSAVALVEAFGGDVGAPDGVARPARGVAEEAGLVVDPWPHPENYDVVVAVDTSSRSQLGRMGARVPAPCLVDHHRYGDLLETAPAAAWDPARASCAEVALALVERAGRAPSPRAAKALLAGLVADSARFRFADAPALETAARLVRLSGASVEEVVARMEREEPEDGGEGDDVERRHASLVAATRAK
ncbi:MAG TPA: DHH family phosphoesterase, partial [Candidatus Thermoplasmatota archaeon]|nr:DHH family phosphoesterase [Candidatus Thermoplasmatota archaeon]